MVKKIVLSGLLISTVVLAAPMAKVGAMEADIVDQEMMVVPNDSTVEDVVTPETTPTTPDVAPESNEAVQPQPEVQPTTPSVSEQTQPSNSGAPASNAGVAVATETGGEVVATSDDATTPVLYNSGAGDSAEAENEPTSPAEGARATKMSAAKPVGTLTDLRAQQPKFLTADTDSLPVTSGVSDRTPMAVGVLASVAGLVGMLYMFAKRMFV